MSRLLIRPEAKVDLDDIWFYIAQDNPNNADRFLDQIQETSLSLANYPQMGTIRNELKADLRSHPIGNYLIFYFPLENGIDIVRVLHRSRNIGILF
jgi:toxin ParE1/3/4